MNISWDPVVVVNGIPEQWSPFKDYGYGAARMTNREKRYLQRLIDRRDLIARKMADTQLRDNSELVQEANALEWAIKKLILDDTLQVV